MSSLDIWVGMAGKPCGSSIRLFPALLSLPILPILHSLWVISSSPRITFLPIHIDSQLHSSILKLSWTYVWYAQWPDVSSWMYPRHFNLNMFKTELFPLVVAPYFLGCGPCWPGPSWLTGTTPTFQTMERAKRECKASSFLWQDEIWNLLLSLLFTSLELVWVIAV